MESENISACDNWTDDPRSPNNPKSSGKFRFLIFALGPTGSGKSTSITKLKNFAQSINSAAYRNTWYEKGLDDYVQENPLYKTSIDSLIKKYHSLDLTTLDGCTIKNKPWKDFAREMTSIYFKSRNDKSSGISIVKQYNRDFNDAITDGKNIVCEITGRNRKTIIETLNDILDKTNNCENYKYIILASYNVVNFYLLQERNISRFKHQYEDFLKDKSKIAPRLPWIGCFSQKNEGIDDGISSYCEVLDSIKNTIVELLNCGFYSSIDKNKEQNNAEVASKSDANNYKNPGYERLTKEGECFFNVSYPNKESNSYYTVPKGLNIDVLYIFNNIYKELTLMAKINLSKRSKYLENVDNFNEKGRPKSYYEVKHVGTLIDIINKEGPPKTESEVYDVCGLGLPLASPTRKTKSNMYVQHKLNQYGGYRKTKKYKGRV
jgi:hypothetical protein